jgi:DNA-binding transcriptional ArsR family regulator
VSEFQFTWGGKSYQVKTSAWQKDYIVLPNRKVLRILPWLKNFSLQVEEVVNHLEHQSIGEIAEHFGNAILAHESD